MVGDNVDGPGGIASVVRTYAEGGLFDDNSVRYLTNYDGAGAQRQIAVMARIFGQLLSLFLNHRPRLVHIHSASRGSYWRAAAIGELARAFKRQYAIHIHSGEFPDFYTNECGPVGRWWVRRTLARAATVICLSAGWKSAVHAIAPTASLSVLENPVHVPAALADKADVAQTVLFLGRLRQKKGIFDLLEAIPIVLASCPGLRFVLAGDEGEEEVRKRAKHLGIENAIELPGWVDGARKLAVQRRSDIFVLPSYFEGLPLGILEAMALGIAVVGTKVGGIPELVRSGVDGVLVAPGDVKGLADAIIGLATDPNRRQALRHAAYLNVKTNYRTDVVLQRLNEIYKQYDGKQ